MQVFLLIYLKKKKKKFNFYQILGSEFDFRCNCAVHLNASIGHQLYFN